MYKARLALLEKSLNQVFRYSEGIMTRKQYIEQYAISFSVLTQPKYEYNRRKYNNMLESEQLAYEEKMKQTKTVYAANLADGAYIEIPKIVYEHFNK